MNMTDFGASLKALRKQKNMTQEVLATQLNVTTSAISKWENGKNLPDIEMMQKLAELFDSSLDELCGVPKALSPHLSLKKRWIPVLLTGILLFGIIGLTLFRNPIQASPTIRPLVSHATVDAPYGTVYELAHVYEGDIHSLSAEIPYITTLWESWRNNNSVDASITVMKVTFYPQPESILYGCNPDKVIYLQR